MFHRLKVGANVSELVSKLVDDLGVVIVAGIQLHRDLAARGSLEKNDGAAAVAGDKDGRIVLARRKREDFDGRSEDGAEVTFIHLKALGRDAQLGGKRDGQAQKEKEEFHFLRFGSRFPFTRAAMRSGQDPSFRSLSQVASMRRLCRTAR